MRWKITLPVIMSILILVIGGIMLLNPPILKNIPLFSNLLPGIVSASTTQSVTYTFTDTTNNKAYNATATNNQTAARLTIGSELPGTGYTLINSNNNQNATATATTANDYDYFRFVFNLNQSASTINYLNITWIGAETCTDTVANVEAVIRNWTSNTWTRIGTVPQAKGTLTLNFTSATAKFHVGSTNNNVTISVDSISDDCDASPEQIRTDFVKLDVTYTDNNPLWSSNSTNGTTAGTYIKHSVNWTDDAGLSGYIFSFDNGTGVQINDTFRTFTGTENWSNVSKWVSTTEGATIRWRVYVNDTANNRNSTGNFTYTTTGGAANCWTYNAGAKLLIIPGGCQYYQSAGTIGSI